jgi:hypothetical protein
LAISWYAADDASCAPSALALVVARDMPATVGTVVVALCSL